MRRRSDIPDLIDDFDGHLARQSRSAETRRHYRRTLEKLADELRYRDASSITRQDCERFLNRWASSAPATLAARIGAVASFTRYLADLGILEHDPMLRVARPRRLPADELDVVTVTTDDVRRMFESCQDWTEAVALSVLVYTGARRGAAARLRWRDVDLARGELRLREKGGRVIVKPLADELRELLIAYSAAVLDLEPDGYVIPNLHPGKVRREQRDEKVVLRIVQRIARRAGVRTHVHALRAAFAVFFLEEHGGTIDALKELLGHRRIETTYVYLRRLDRRRQMEQVRALSWGSVLPPNRGEAHTGFEPVFPTSDEESPSGGNRGRVRPLIENPWLRAVVERLEERQR